MRRLLWATALAGLLVVGIHLRPDRAELAATAGHAPPSTGPVVSVHYDFAGGLGGAIKETAGLLDLVEVGVSGGELILLPRGADWAVHFPINCRGDLPECPRAVLQSGPAELLNPGTRQVRWGVSVQMMPNEVSDGANLVQKGLFISGKQFKLQIDGMEGRPSCVVAGLEGRFLALAPQGIADGQWHDLRCERINDLLTLYVDGVRVADTPIPAELSIVNGDPLTVGGKGNGPSNDQFHGTLDDVFIQIG